MDNRCIIANIPTGKKIKLFSGVCMHMHDLFDYGSRSEGQARIYNGCKILYKCIGISTPKPIIVIIEEDPAESKETCNVR